MKLKRFKEKNNKRIGIIVFTLVCILLVSGAIFYRTFAIFEVKTSQNVIKGTVQDPGNIYFAFYVNDGTEDKIQKEMPTKNYVLDETKSYCGVNGERDEKIKVTLTDEYGIYVTGVTTSRTKCNLYFVSGAFILGKPIKAVTSGEGLYEVTHEDVSGTIKDDGFKETEFRYAGEDPSNYINFNDEAWRIIGLVNVMTSDNKVEQRIKIIKADSIGSYSWDSSSSDVNSGSGVNEWSQAKLKTLLNDFYYNDYGTTHTHNCYYEANNSTKECNFQDNGLKNYSKEMIDEDIIWNIGSSAGTNYTSSIVDNYYAFERGNNLKTCSSSELCNDNVTRTNVWDKSSEGYHGIGLIYPSDYRYASSGNDEVPRGRCLTNAMFYWSEIEACKKNDWLSSPKWTLTSVTYGDRANLVFAIIPNGIDHLSVASSRDVYPTLYLKPNVKIIDGTGSKDDAYVITKTDKIFLE